VIDGSYNEKCDLWSMGVILYIMLSGRMPFSGDTNDDIIEAISKGKYHFNYSPFKNISALAKSLITDLLVLDVEKRLSAEEAYNHPFI
jgi:calcium-dependent protein kinase